MTYYLITDSTADEVERLTGIRGLDMPSGVLVEKPRPFRLDVELEKLDRHLRPNPCTCGTWAIIHRPGCPAGDLIP